MIVLSISVLVSLFTPFASATLVAIGGLAVFAIAGQPLFGRRERFLLTLACTLSLAVFWISPDPAALYYEALDRATFLAAFMILLALLRDGAVTSPAVLDVGTYLTRQPPGRRYLSIHFGGHALSILLNFGALNLLGPLIMRGIDATTPDPRLADIRRERQISALMRGFSLMVVWSPTAVTQALVFTMLPDAQYSRMVLVGLVIVVLNSLAGWLIDWRTGERARRVIPPEERPQFPAGLPFPRRSFLHFAAVCGLLVATTLAIMALGGVSTVPALTLSAPLVTLVWLVRQSQADRNAGKAVVNRVRSIATKSIPLSGPEAFTLSVAGYCGIVAAGLVNPDAFASIANLEHWPEFALYAAAIIIPFLFSNVGIPPIMTTTFLGTLMASLPGLDFDATLLAMAFCIGWALNLTGSPLGLSAVILSRITGEAGRRLTWTWNGVYTMTCLGIACLVLYVASHVW